MFLYMSGGINNDVIAAFSGTAIVYACIRLLDRVCNCVKLILDTAKSQQQSVTTIPA